MTLLGGKGLRQLAQLNHARAVQLADALGAIDGVEILTDAFFNEFSLRVKAMPQALSMRWPKRMCLAACRYRGLPPMPVLMICCLSRHGNQCEDDIAAFQTALQEVLS